MEESTITFLGVPPAVSPVFMAVAVMIVVLAQSRRVRALLRGAGSSLRRSPSLPEAKVLS